MATFEELKPFVGKVLRATCENTKCVEDIPEIREYLANKYGAENIKETPSSFKVNGKTYFKPWLPRVRIVTFGLMGTKNYAIKIHSSSTTEGRVLPRNSIYPIHNLHVLDKDTLVVVLDMEKASRIIYKVQDYGV